MDSVSESEMSYTATILTSVEGMASSGLVEVYALLGEGNATRKIIMYSIVISLSEVFV